MEKNEKKLKSLDEAVKERDRLYREFKRKKKFFEEEEQREGGINVVAWVRNEISKEDYERRKKEIAAEYEEKIRDAYGEYEVREKTVWVEFGAVL